MRFLSIENCDIMVDDSNISDLDLLQEKLDVMKLLCVLLGYDMFFDHHFPYNSSYVIHVLRDGKNITSIGFEVEEDHIVKKVWVQLNDKMAYYDLITDELLEVMDEVMLCF